MFVLMFPPTSIISALSLPDALPIFQAVVADLPAELQPVPDQRLPSQADLRQSFLHALASSRLRSRYPPSCPSPRGGQRDRKSTRLNSSHTVISYSDFCLNKKNTILL